jgi:hypothetical protein
LVIDQGPRLFPAGGFCCREERPGFEAKNRYLTRLLAERGDRDAFTHLVGDLSILDDLLIVSVPEGEKLARDLRLPEPWDKVRRLTEETDGTVRRRARSGTFKAVLPGIYRMHS